MAPLTCTTTVYDPWLPVPVDGGKGDAKMRGASKGLRNRSN